MQVSQVETFKNTFTAICMCFAFNHMHNLQYFGACGLRKIHKSQFNFISKCY